jgi:hypothetical protein
MASGCARTNPVPSSLASPSSCLVGASHMPLNRLLPVRNSPERSSAWNVPCTVSSDPSTLASGLDPVFTVLTPQPIMVMALSALAQDAPLCSRGRRGAWRRGRCWAQCRSWSRRRAVRARIQDGACAAHGGFQPPHPSLSVSTTIACALRLTFLTPSRSSAGIYDHPGIGSECVPLCRVESCTWRRNQRWRACWARGGRRDRDTSRGQQRDRSRRRRWTVHAHIRAIPPALQPPTALTTRLRS